MSGYDKLDDTGQYYFDVSMDDAIKMLNWSRQQIWMKRDEKGFPDYKMIGGRVKFHRGQMLRFVDKQNALAAEYSMSLDDAVKFLNVSYSWFNKYKDKMPKGIKIGRSLYFKPDDIKAIIS
jgi:predicted DNA-binding transcriptional regulator AlpA